MPTYGSFIRSAGWVGRSPASFIAAESWRRAVTLWRPNPRHDICWWRTSALSVSTLAAFGYFLLNAGQIAATISARVCFNRTSARRIPNGLTFSSRQGNERPRVLNQFAKKPTGTLTQVSFWRGVSQLDLSNPSSSNVCICGLGFQRVPQSLGDGCRDPLAEWRGQGI